MLYELWSYLNLNIFSLLKNAVCNVLWVYLDSNFLERVMAFLMVESVSLCTLSFLRRLRSRSSSIIQDSDWQSALISRAISADVEWVSGSSSWLRINSLTSLMFFSVRRDLVRPEPSFWPTSPISSLIFNIFFTPFTFHLYSRWTLIILKTPYLYFNNYFFLVEINALLVTNNLI